MARIKSNWKTRMFDLAESQNLSLGELAKRGGNIYSVSYLSLIKNGKRSVPASLDFQNWVAGILKVPRTQLFFQQLDTITYISDGSDSF